MAFINFKSQEENDVSRFDPLAPNTEIQIKSDINRRAELSTNWKDISEIFRPYEEIFTPGAISVKDARRALFENADKLGLGATDVNNFSNSSAAVASTADGKVRIEQFAKYISFELLNGKPDVNHRPRSLRQHSAPSKQKQVNNPFESFMSSTQTGSKSEWQECTNPFEQFESQADKKSEVGKYVDTIYEHMEALEKNQSKENPFATTFRGYDFDQMSNTSEDEKNHDSRLNQKKDVFGFQMINEKKADRPADKPEPQTATGENRADEETSSSSSSSSSESDRKVESPDEKSALFRKANTNALLEMRRGTSMLKHGKYGFPHFRRFQISEDHQRFQWYSRRKSLSDTSVAISDIQKIVVGQNTDAFKKSNQMSNLMQASFSIIYGPKQKTVDLIAKSADEASLWIAGLKELLRASKSGKDLSKIEHIDAGFVFNDISRPGYTVKSVKKKKARQSLPTLREQWRRDSASDILSPNFQRILRTNNFRIRRSKSQSLYEGNVKSMDLGTNKSQRKLIRKDLAKVKTAFQRLLSWSRSSKISESAEFVTVSTLLAEFEQRIGDCEQMVDNLGLDIHVIKRDLWILKIDIYALDDFILVLAG